MGSLINLSVSSLSSMPDWIPRLLRQVEGISLDQNGDTSYTSFLLSVTGGKDYAFAVQSFPSLSREKALDLVKEWKTAKTRQLRPLIAEGCRPPFSLNSPPHFGNLMRKMDDFRHRVPQIRSA